MASNMQSRSTGETNLRHVWLAGLGLASVLRREAVNANERALAETRRLQRRASGVLADARSQVIAGADSLREQLDPIVAKVTNEIGLRVAPALKKLGLQSLLPPLARKPATKKTTRRAASRRARITNRNA